MIFLSLPGDVVGASQGVFLRLECAQKSPGVHVKAVFDSVGLQWGLRFCISNKVPGAAAAGAGLWTAFLVL